MDSTRPASASAVRGTPRGITAITIFLLFGALMASIAGSTLLWPGTIVDHMWALNPRAYKELAPLGRLAGVAFLLVGATIAAASLGWSRHRRWGWRMAVAIISIQLLGDLFNLFLGSVLEGAFGAAVAGALVYYLLRPRTRAVFRP